MTINKIRGMRDIIPFSKYTKLYENLRSHLLLHNFEEINTPIFEYEELFLKNLGIDTDIVNKEMYYVRHMHGEAKDAKMVLRPELTASIMRAYVENKIQEMPWKVFQIGSAFRHERPQKGRYREFYTCSIELINAASIGYDVYLLYMLYNFFSYLIGDNFSIEINYICTNLERDKFRDALYDYCLMREYDFPESVRLRLHKNSILRILDSKDRQVQEVLAEAPLIENFWNSDNIAEWNKVNECLRSLNVPFIHNRNLIRGLDYYNGIIFEFVSKNLGAQNTFCGGGRYDSLSLSFIDKIIPSLGAGIGIDRLLLIIDEIAKNNLINCKKFFVPIILNHFSYEFISFSLIIQNILLNCNIYSDIYFDKVSYKSGLKKANQEFASYVIMLDEDCIKQKVVIVKNMKSNYLQDIISVDQVAKYMLDKLQLD